MPSYKNILASNERRLDITDYCRDILDEGETEAWITIKKMPKDLKRKISVLSMEKMSKKTSKELLKGLKEKGLTLEDVKDYKNLDNETSQKVIEIYLDADIDLEGKRGITEFENEIEKIIFEKCIDKEKHNFINITDKGKDKIDISNYEFWNQLGKDNLILFIVNEIKNFSEDFFFETNGEKKSNGQLEISLSE